jgi:hypothetical protein
MKVCKNAIEFTKDSVQKLSKILEWFLFHSIPCCFWASSVKGSPPFLKDCHRTILLILWRWKTLSFFLDPPLLPWSQQSNSLTKYAWFELVIIAVFLVARLALKSTRRGLSYFVVDFFWHDILLSFFIFNPSRSKFLSLFITSLSVKVCLILHYLCLLGYTPKVQ